MESLAKYVADEYDNKLKEKVDTSDWACRCEAGAPTVADTLFNA